MFSNDSNSYENQIKAAASKFLDAHRLREETYKAKCRAQSDWEAAGERLETARKELDKFVGANIPERTVILADGVVIIERGSARVANGIVR